MAGDGAAKDRFSRYCRKSAAAPATHGAEWLVPEEAV